MTSKRRLKLLYLCLLMLGASAITALVLYALRQNINLFFTPSQLLEKMPRQRVRLGGMVAKNSVRYLEGLHINFTVTDFENSLPVDYTGILPDLFKEGQGVVMLGRLADQIFMAEQILAKHDQNYMP